MKVLSQRAIPEAYRLQVDEIWEKREPHHFNGQILSLRSYSPSLLVVDVVDYRAWYACVREPSLQRALDIHPLSVSGRVICDGKILIGRRSQHVSSFKGCLECCPSGSVAPEAGTPEKAIRAELSEETKGSSIRKIIPKAVYWSLDDGAWDVHMDIVCDRVDLVPTKEYEELFWFDPKEKKKDLGKWVPLSKHLVQLAIEYD